MSKIKKILALMIACVICLFYISMDKYGIINGFLYTLSQLVFGVVLCLASLWWIDKD